MFPWDTFTLYIDRGTAICCDILYGPGRFNESIFDDLLIAGHWWKKNLTRPRFCSLIHLSQLSTGFRQMWFITKLVENRSFHFRTFDSQITETEIDSLDVNPKDDF